MKNRLSKAETELHKNLDSLVNSATLLAEKLNDYIKKIRYQALIKRIKKTCACITLSIIFALILPSF